MSGDEREDRADAEAAPERPAGGPAPRDGAPPAGELSAENTVGMPGDEHSGSPPSPLRSAGVEPPDLDSRLAQLAVESGMATATAVRACLDAVRQYRAEGVDMSLAEVLVKRGILTRGQGLNALLEIARQGSSANVIGGYHLLEKVGEGAMGAVYKARQISLERVVALKIIPDRAARNTDFVDRFVREAKAAARLDHPNIVRAIDVGKAGGKFYFAMEFVEGKSLRHILMERHRLPEEEALGMIIQAARGLEAAWRCHLIHRDIKPDNILVTKDGVVKIADLGLAREADTEGAARLTRDGDVVGTPHYISPEQAHGEHVDIRTDIYSLGVTLYRMVTGEFPFAGPDPVSIVMARFRQTPRPVNEVNPEVSDELASVVATMMCFDAEHRYPDPAVLLHDLDLVAGGRPPEFASGEKSARARAIQAGRRRMTGTVTMVPVVIRKRRRREWLFAAVGAGVAAAAVVVALLAGLRGLGERPPGAGDTARGEGAPIVANARPQPLVDPAEIRAKEAQEALETEAARLLEEMSKAFEAGEYEEIASRIEAAGPKYATTRSGPTLDSLGLRAVTKFEEAVRRAEEEARREKHYLELIKLAREELAAGDYGRATDLLLQAKTVKDAKEVAKLLNAARCVQHLARADEAEKAGKLKEAARLYEQALAIKEDAGARSRLRGVERRIALGAKLTGATEFARRGNWEAAREAYREALSLATEDESGDIRLRLGAVEQEVRYLGAIERARALEREGRWTGLLEVAAEASRMKPEAEEPKRLVVAARRGLGPEKEIVNSIGMAIRLVPAGEPLLGSASGDPDEGPPHKVRLGAFYIGKFEVTNAQYEKFDPRHRRTEFSPADDTPVVAVSWRDADAFCQWLSREEGIKYRLPTEAEWEYAARGSDGRRFPWGADAPDADGKWRSNIAPGRQRDRWADDGHRYAAPVGSYPEGVSPFGVHDLAGNAWEWCLDWYRLEYHSTGGARDPGGSPEGKQRVLRGGSFATGPRSARCANRTAHEPGFVEASVGFRVVRALDPIFRERSGKQTGERR